VIQVRCDASINFLVKAFILSIPYVDPHIAGNSVDEYNAHQFSLHWPREDEIVVQIVSSIEDKTILSIVNAAITGLPDQHQQQH
jgi:hypothetical protein